MPRLMRLQQSRVPIYILCHYPGALAAVVGGPAYGLVADYFKERKEIALGMVESCTGLGFLV